MNLHVVPFIEGHTNTWVFSDGMHVATLWRVFNDEIEVYAVTKAKAYEHIGNAKTIEDATGMIHAHFVWKRINQ